MEWLDLLREIGFSPLSYAHVVIAYLPNKDKNAKEFDVEPVGDRGHQTAGSALSRGDFVPEPRQLPPKRRERGDLLWSRGS